MSYSLKARVFFQQISPLIQGDIKSQIILATLAEKLGKFFTAQACFIGTKDYQLTGIWQNHNNLPPNWHTRIDQFFRDETPQNILAITLILNEPNTLEYLVIIVGDTKWGKPAKQLLENLRDSLTIVLKIAFLKQRIETTFLYQSLFEAIGNKMGQISDINSILELTLQDTAQALEVERGFIVMIKYKNPFWATNYQEIPEANLEIVCQWQREKNSKKQPNALLKFFLKDSPLCCQAWQNIPHPLPINNQDELNLITQKEPEIFQLDFIGSILITPLIGSYTRQENKPLVLGFSVLINSHPRLWQFDQIQLAKWVAIQASSSLIQNQTLQRVQSLVEERTAQLKTSLEVQAKLSEKMRRHIEELQKLNTIKDDFIATLSDELKHPLTKIKMSIEMLKLAKDKQQSERYLKILENECIKEINLVNDLLTIQQLESKQLKINPEGVNLKNFLHDLTLYYQQEWLDKGLTFIVDNPNLEEIILYTDLDSLQRILRELLNNAGKFSLENTTVLIKMIPNNQDQKITINVINVGKKISQEEQLSIFEAFHRGEDVNKGSNQGTGLGLALVKSLVQYLSGTIAVSSYPQDNSNHYLNCFTLTFPLGKNAQF